MLMSVFSGLFDSDTQTVISVGDFLLCLGVALALGVIVALVYMYKSRYTKSFVLTLALLPAVVCLVIMMVNGNVGAGVAVAGAFSLVRFRSVPGTAKEIGTIFLAMSAGLVVGMGYLAYAALFVVVICAIMLLCQKLGFGGRRADVYRTLRITIPEDLDYTQVFDEILKEYTKSYEAVSTKTTNLGSMFRLTYNIEMKDCAQEKQMIDALRCRNGNLEISVSRQEASSNEL